MTRRFARAPGRVNLIGDHTDYNEGLALPMAVDLATDVSFEPTVGDRIVLRSQSDPEPCDIDRNIPFDVDVLRLVEPVWARIAAAVVASTRPDTGGVGEVTTTLPLGAGLSSSAALEVALALALGFEGPPLTMARMCQRCEQAATGVPTGLMDQLVVAGAVEGTALFVDFAQLTTEPVPIPDRAEVVVVDSGERRRLGQTAYAARRAECEAASFHLGPLGRVGPEAVMGLPDPLLRRRARHVITECDRVRWCAAALRADDLVEAGRLMSASHRSLAQDFEVSTPRLDGLVDRLCATPGVYGARLTGAGFGGCVVALTERGALDLGLLETPAWTVRPAAGACLIDPPS